MTNNPKAQFQLNNGNGWQTVAEVDIIDGVIPPPPNAFSMARVLHKQIVYVGYTPVKTTVVPSDERTTHFAGFAKALFNEMYTTDNVFYGTWQAAWQQIIARRVYDLVAHVLLSAPTSALEHCHSAYEAGWNIQHIPDLLELPTEEVQA